METMRLNVQFYFWVVLVWASVCISCAKPKAQVPNNIRYTPVDSTEIERILKQNPHTFINVAKLFLGTPYVAHTLENDSCEQLTINIREFDCTTLVESSLALYRASKKRNTSFTGFANELRQMRYRNGQVKGYPSRLHYVSEWIVQNTSTNLFEDLTPQLGGLHRSDSIHFMSSNAKLYKQLASNPEFISEIKQTENKLNKLDRYFIPKAQVADIEPMLDEGWIVAISTDIKGLDFVHMGITVRVDGRIHLLHASSDAGKVVISEQPLAEYLAANKRQSGIAVLKPKP